MGDRMMHGHSATRSRSGGFSLLEILVAMSVLIAAVAAIAPALAAMTRRNNEGATQDQLRAIHSAIFGNRAGRTYGFLGDVGRLPTSLTELASIGTLPAFHKADGATPHIGNVGYGWSGPYISGVFDASDLVTDAWGQTLSYTNSGGNAGKIISAGADGTLGTADDITFPTHTPASVGTLHLTVVANGIANPFGAGAKVYYPLNGEQAVTATQRHDPSLGPFEGMTFTVPAGIRVAVVTHTGVGAGGGGCTTVSRTVPVNVVAGRTNSLEVRMETRSVVTVTGNFPCTVPD